MSTLKLICLDLDDTLWPSERTIEHAETVYYQALEKLAPGLCALYDADALRQHRLDMLKRKPELKHHISRWRLESLEAALRDTGHGDHSQRIAELAFAAFLEARHQVSLFAHCEAVLEALSKSFRLVGLTNGNADLAKIPAGRHFSGYFRAEELGVGKPEPQLFEAALDFAACTARQAVHIGDHVIDDIGGAKAAGLYALQARLTENALPPSPLADGHFEDWRQLPKLINTINKGLAD